MSLTSEQVCLRDELQNFIEENHVDQMECAPIVKVTPLGRRYLERAVSARHMTNILLPWLEQKLTEAQAETVERCITHLKSKIPGGQFFFEELRALSPDPHARERWELKARLETAERIEGLCIARTIADAKALHDYIADLKCQLAALPQV